MSDERYDEDYFLRGRETHKSLYEDYHWLPDLTIPMARCIVDHLGIKQGDTILDFGCARGYVVRALRELGHTAYGYDTSEWAIENADLSVYPHLTRQYDIVFSRTYDWILAKDVLEHIEYVERTIRQLLEYSRRGLFAVVPLSAFDNQPYVISDYESDVTHCQRMTLMSWVNMFMQPRWAVTSQYRLEGVKDNWFKLGWEKGNGFLTCHRLAEKK